MRGLVSPFVIVALLILTFAVYIEYLKLSEINENINNELKLDIKNHEKVLDNIARIARLKHRIYLCSRLYNCTNLTSFISNISNCAGVQVYFNDSFYFVYNNTKFKLDEVSCKYGQNKET